MTRRGELREQRDSGSEEATTSRPVRRRRSRADRRSDFQRILASAGSVWKRHALFFVGAALLFQFPCGVYVFVAVRDLEDFRASWVYYSLYAWISQSSHFFASAFVYGAVSQFRQGEAVRYGDSVRMFFSRAVPVVVTCLVAGFFVGLLRGFLPDLLLGVSFLLQLFFIVIGVIALCAVWLAGVVAVTQSVGPIAAIRESIRLTARRKATIFVVVLVLGAINAAANLFLPNLAGFTAGVLGAWFVRVVVESFAVVACCIVYEMYGDMSKRVAKVFE